MRHTLRTRQIACAAAIATAILTVSSGLSHAALIFSTSTSYRTGEDPYHENPDFGSTGVASGTAAASLDHSGAGPLGGVFSFSGSAQSAVGALKARAAITLSDYPLGSYWQLLTPGFDYTPQSGFGQSSVTDQVVVSGGDATYDVEFTYQLTGEALIGRQHPSFFSFFRPLVQVTTAFHELGTFVSVGSGATTFFPEDGTYNSPLILIAHDIPSNTQFDLRQVLQVRLYSADSAYVTDIDPYETGDWDPSHIIHEAELVGVNPYSWSFYGDFSHTLELRNVTLRDGDGNVAEDASLVSRNGVHYPGQAVPEPSMLVMACGCLATLPILRCRRR